MHGNKSAYHLLKGALHPQPQECYIHVHTFYDSIWANQPIHSLVPCWMMLNPCLQVINQCRGWFAQPVDHECILDPSSSAQLLLCINVKKSEAIIL